MTVASYRYDDDPEPRPSFAGGWVLWGLLAIITIVITGSSFVPSGYVIERPGEVRDVLGTVEVDGSPVAVIDIPSQQTYPTTGSLDMLTVSTLGNPDRTPTWLQVAQAWIDPTQEIVPVDEAFPGGETTEQSAEEAALQMEQSQQTAIAAALGATGYEYSTTVSVALVSADGPSAELLEVGDVITAVSAVPVDDPTSLRAAIAASGVDQPLTLTVTRKGVAVDVSVTPVLDQSDDPQPVIASWRRRTSSFRSRSAFSRATSADPAPAKSSPSPSSTSSRPALSSETSPSPAPAPSPPMDTSARSVESPRSSTAQSGPAHTSFSLRPRTALTSPPVRFPTASTSTP